MLVLWNGEYEEREINDFSEKHLKYMDEQHQKWVGHVVGDFTALKVEYDWGRRDQRWTIKCNLCGRELYQYHVADWRRGKGRSLECKCRKEAKQAEKEREEQKRKARAEERKAKAEAKKSAKIKKEPGGLMILSAFCLPSAMLSDFLSGGLGLVFLPLATDGTKETEDIGILISFEVRVVLGSHDPCFREFLENSFSLGICDSFHLSLFPCL